MSEAVQNQCRSGSLNERPTRWSKRDLDFVVDTTSAQQQEELRFGSAGWGAAVKLSQLGTKSSMIVRARCLRGRGARCEPVREKGVGDRDCFVVPS